MEAYKIYWAVIKVCHAVGVLVTLELPIMSLMAAL